MRASAKECAKEIMDVVPLVMRAIRSEIRGQRGGDLTVPQLRTMAYIESGRGCTLSAVAEHIGLTLPSMSKLVDGLVDRKLVSRQIQRQDRRCVTLELTARGGAVLGAALHQTRNCLEERFADLSYSELDSITTAMRVLRLVFTPEGEPQAQFQAPGHQL